MNKIEKLQQQIKDSKRIVFFGGAGVSTESGIPDFRSAGGIFVKEAGYQYSPEEIISHSFFQQHPKVFFDFYFDKLIYPDAKPNSTHQFIADLEKVNKDVTVITQNIDGLHQDAGSTTVYELHGTVRENYCLNCHREFKLEELEKDADGIPRCPDDQGIVRPNIVLYQEGLDQDILKHAIKAIQEADMLIIGGTSLVVYPAAGLVNYFGGKHLVVINKTIIQAGQYGALTFEDSLSNVFNQIKLR